MSRFPHPDGKRGELKIRPMVLVSVTLRSLGALVLLFALGAVPLAAEVELAPLFRDGAILQQGVPVPVWGTAEAGESIVVRFKGQVRPAIADADLWDEH